MPIRVNSSKAQPAARAWRSQPPRRGINSNVRKVSATGYDSHELGSVDLPGEHQLLSRSVATLSLRPEFETEPAVTASVGGRPRLMPTVDVKRTTSPAAVWGDADAQPHPKDK